MDLIRKRIEAKAKTYADAGNLVSMADARWLVLEICREIGQERPSPDSLEYYAAELVRLTLEAHDGRVSRLRLHRVG
jgi:hypothetical protein